MTSCFVIQPFCGTRDGLLDTRAHDRRYEDVFEPAIRDAGLEPCRAGGEPGASLSLAEIEAGISNAALCVADITTDDANVWFALGFAMASHREVVLVCANSRQRFPIDIQRRSVIFHAAEANSDFETLRGQITRRIKTILKASLLRQAKAGAAAGEGLASHELVALAAVGQNLENPGDSVSSYAIRRDMEHAGFTRIAVTSGLASLVTKGFVSVREEYDDRTGEVYATYSLTDAGMNWLLSNLDRLVLTQPSTDDTNE